jgi:hypothetical protein
MAFELAADSIREDPRFRDVNLARNLLQDVAQLGLQRAMMPFGSQPETLDDSVISPTYQVLAHKLLAVYRRDDIEMLSWMGSSAEMERASEGCQQSRYDSPQIDNRRER